MPGQPSNLEEGFFPVIWAQLPKKGFNIDPPSVKLFFQNRNQGGYGNPSISNLTLLSCALPILTKLSAMLSPPGRRKECLCSLACIFIGFYRYKYTYIYIYSIYKWRGLRFPGASRNLESLIYISIQKGGVGGF